MHLESAVTGRVVVAVAAARGGVQGALGNCCDDGARPNSEDFNIKRWRANRERVKYCK